MCHGCLASGRFEGSFCFFRDSILGITVGGVAAAATPVFLGTGFCMGTADAGDSPPFFSYQIEYNGSGNEK